MLRDITARGTYIFRFMGFSVMVFLLRVGYIFLFPRDAFDVKLRSHVLLLLPSNIGFMDLFFHIPVRDIQILCLIFAIKVVKCVQPACARKNVDEPEI